MYPSLDDLVNPVVLVTPGDESFGDGGALVTPRRGLIRPVTKRGVTTEEDERAAWVSKGRLKVDDVLVSGAGACTEPVGDDCGNAARDDDPGVGEGGREAGPGRVGELSERGENTAL